MQQKVGAAARSKSAAPSCQSFCARLSRAIFVGGSHVASLRPFRIVSKTLNKKIDKVTNFHGKVPCRRIDRIKGQKRGLVFIEKASQQSLPKRLLRNERRKQGNSTTFYCGIAQQLRVVRAEEPGWLDPVISVIAPILLIPPACRS